MFTCVGIHMYIFQTSLAFVRDIFANTHTHTHAHIYMYMYMYIYIYVDIYLYVYVDIYIYTYVYIYINICTSFVYTYKNACRNVKKIRLEINVRDNDLLGAGRHTSMSFVRCVDVHVMSEYIKSKNS